MSIWILIQHHFQPIHTFLKALRLLSMILLI
jgi:hypothetical protein